MLDIIFTVTNDLSFDQRMQRICKSMVAHGYSVLIVGRTKKDSIALEEKPYRQKRLKCIFQKGFFFYAEYNIRLLLFLFFNRSKAICSVDLDSVIPGRIASFLTRRKLIFDAHEYYLGSPELINRSGVKKIWKLISDWVLPGIKFNTTVSNEVKSIYELEYDTSFKVIRNMPYLQKKAVSEKQKDLVIYQGVLNLGRGLFPLLDCVAAFSNISLWVAGDGDIGPELKSYAEHLKIMDRVMFLGALAPKELKKITPKARIGINLLNPESENNYYSLANKFFDYVQAGVPVLTMNFPEYKAHNEAYEVARLIDNLEVQTISEAMDKMLNDQVYYQKLVDNCRSASRSWNWEAEEEHLIQFYKEEVELSSSDPRPA